MAEFGAYIRGICTRLEKILIEDRNKAHGDAEESFQLIADYWGYYLDKPLKKEDICIMMALLKIARINGGDKNNPDHLLDMAGYSILGLAMKEKQNN
tara:strand:+ start:252 stop:542 length:291 start_codon:yes stop_codon:yes gene_type:complete